MSSLTYPRNDSPCLPKPHLSGFIIPVISTLLGIFAFHEPFVFQTAIGAALVLGGVALTQRATIAT
jgi:drug/metabolite transporter (DMT)-like permease